MSCIIIEKPVMHWTHGYVANKNVFNEHLKDSSLQFGSRRSADCRCLLVGGWHSTVSQVLRGLVLLTLA